MKYKYNVVEFVKEGFIKIKKYNKIDSKVVKEVKRDGIIKRCYMIGEDREWIVESDVKIDFDEEGSWMWGEGFNN